MGKMKKIIFFIMIFLSIGVVTNAATKEDLIVAINKTYYVAGKAYILPENIRVKGINYLRTHYFTEDECTKIMQYIDEAVAFANEVGTTDITKVSSEDINKGMKIVSKAVVIADSAPTIEEMKAKEAEKLKLLEEQKKKEAENKVIKSENEKSIYVNNQTVDKSDTEVTVKKENDKNIEKQDEYKEQSVEENENKEIIYDDEIDYSKYLSEEQFEEVNFEDIKSLVEKEVEKFSIKIIAIFIILFIIFVLIIIFLVVKLRGNANKTKEEH